MPNPIDLWKVFIDAQDFILNTLPPFYFKKDTVEKTGVDSYKAEVDLSIYKKKANQIIREVIPDIATKDIDYEKGIITKSSKLSFDTKIYEKEIERIQQNHLDIYPNPAILLTVKPELSQDNIWEEISKKNREHPIERKRGIAYLQKEEIEKIEQHNFPISIEDVKGAVLNGVKISDQYRQKVASGLEKCSAQFENAKINNTRLNVYNEWIDKNQCDNITKTTNTYCKIYLGVRVENNDYLYDYEQDIWRRSLGLYWTNELGNESASFLFPRPRGDYFSFSFDSGISQTDFYDIAFKIKEKFANVFGNENVRVQYKFTFNLDKDLWIKKWHHQLQKNNISYYPNIDTISFDFESIDELQEIGLYSKTYH